MRIFRMRGSYHPAIQTAFAVLETLQAGREVAVWAQRERIPIYFSDFWGGEGGSSWFGWIYLPSRMEKDVPPGLLAHELLHCRQGLHLFGCLELEQPAYVIQWRCDLELLRREDPQHPHVEQKQAELEVLEAGGAPAHEFIRGMGDYYRTFPVEPPRLWQVNKWWPQVRYGLSLLFAS